MDKKECLLERYGADATIPIDVGEGWTLYINWVRDISGNQIAEKGPCPIEEWVKKIKSYKRSESPRATHDQFECNNCQQIVNASIYRSDAFN